MPFSHCTIVRNMLALFSLLLLSFYLVGCSTSTTTAPTFYPGNQHLYFPHHVRSGAPLHYENDNRATSNLWQRLRSNFSLPGYEDRPEVQKQIRWFQSHPGVLIHSLKHASPYLYYIFEEARKRNVPAELVLLPVIESSYNPFAASPVGASGLWQIMPGTARHFHLPRNFWFDGRRDVRYSTQMALNYLSYLYEFFNHDWLLAIAAYDCGEGTVWNALEANLHYGLPPRFWDLPLPHESQNYVPRLLAVVDIVRDPSHYGFTLPTTTNHPYIGSVELKQSMPLHHIAALANISTSELHALNPGFNRWSDSTHGQNTILIPSDKVATFTQRFKAMAAAERQLLLKHQYGGAIIHHTVVPGETLFSIARRYHTTTTAIKRSNHLNSNRLAKHQVLLISVRSHAVAKTTHAYKSKNKISSSLHVKHKKIIHAKHH